VLVVSVQRYPVQWTGRLAVVTLPAEIDISNADRVQAELLSLLEQGAITLVMDMSATTFCDSAGVHAVVAARTRAVASGAELRLVSSFASVLRVLAITGVDQLVGVYSSLDEATGKPPAVLGNPDNAVSE
jgi:anti-sigma B factor antagonist